MATMADANPVENPIWNNPAWMEQREKAKTLRALYDGEEWATAKDADGNLLYPLKLNPAAKVCRIHRAVLFGMRDVVPTMPVHHSHRLPGQYRATRRYEGDLGSGVGRQRWYGYAGRGRASASDLWRPFLPGQVGALP